MTKLIDRLAWAQDNLKPVVSDYRIVWEDPDDIDAPAKVTIPDPRFMAAALNGGVLPPIGVVLSVTYDDAGSPTNYHTVHDAPPLPPMTEEAAIVYLLMKDIPRRVWCDTEANRPRFRICKIDQLPKSRDFRNAWRLAA